MRPLFFLLFAFVIIFADQASKWFVMEHILRPGSEPSPVEAQTPIPPPGFLEWYQSETTQIMPVERDILSFFNLVSVWNKGVSFGMFNQQSDYGPMILICLSLVIALFFVVWLFRGPDNMQAVGIAMVIGGALGNVLDRLRFGAVFDFLDFHAFDYHWPAFNIADSGIVLGVAVLIVHSFLFDKKYQE